MSKDVDAILGIEITDAQWARPARRGDTTHPLYGVKGWLFFGVVVNLYVAPVLFVLIQILTWVGYGLAMPRYPGVVIVGLYGTLFGSYLVWRGMQIARGFRELRPRSVQNAKALLWLNAVYVLVGIPVSFMSGLGPERLIGGIVKSLALTAVSFTVIYSYLNVSRRIEVNFPDWKDN